MFKWQIYLETTVQKDELIQKANSIIHRFDVNMPLVLNFLTLTFSKNSQNISKIILCRTKIVMKIDHIKTFLFIF